jgi:hypothetical protein
MYKKLKPFFFNFKLFRVHNIISYNFYQKQVFLVKFLYEIQYLTAYIFGNIHPRQNIKIVSNRSNLKFLFFLNKYKNLSFLFFGY